jgi:hypothetical protein
VIVGMECLAVGLLKMNVNIEQVRLDFMPLDKLLEPRTRMVKVKKGDKNNKRKRKTDV